MALLDEVSEGGEFTLVDERADEVPVGAVDADEEEFAFLGVRSGHERWFRQD